MVSASMLVTDAVELAGVVLVHRFNIVVHLNDVDLDAVLVGPFLDDTGLLGIGPGHPAGIDRPADVEFGLLLGLSGGREQSQHCGSGQHACHQGNLARLTDLLDHDSPLSHRTIAAMRGLVHGNITSSAFGNNNASATGERPRHAGKTPSCDH
jgi:hypothetical protein